MTDAERKRARELLGVQDRYAAHREPSRYDVTVLLRELERLLDELNRVTWERDEARKHANMLAEQAPGERAAAFRAGAEAMRKAAASYCEAVHFGVTPRIVDGIRALPLPTPTGEQSVPSECRHEWVDAEGGLKLPHLRGRLRCLLCGALTAASEED